MKIGVALPASGNLLKRLIRGPDDRLPILFYDILTASKKDVIEHEQASKKAYLLRTLIVMRRGS